MTPESADHGTDAPEPRTARRRIRNRATAVERRELTAAIRTLNAAGGSTPEQRRVVAEMADAIVAGLVATSDAALHDAAPGDDRVRVVDRLFAED